MTEITARIIAAIKAVPPGSVASYHQIGIIAGLPNGARQVARVLHSMSEKYGLPWQRVIRADGSIALRSGQGRELQIALLQREGVTISKNSRVDMKAYGWRAAG